MASLSGISLSFIRADQCMFLTLLRHCGKVITCLDMTGLSILLSLVIAYALTAVQGEQLEGVGLINTLLEPAIIGPLLSWQTLDPLKRLDEAERKRMRVHTM